MANGSATDRTFHIVLQLVTTGVAVVVLVIGFADRIHGVASDLKGELGGVKTQLATTATQLDTIQRDLDEHQQASAKAAETRANYHHTSQQLNCALCKNLMPDKAHRMKYTK